MIFENASDSTFAEHFEIACETLRERCTLLRNRRGRGRLANMTTAERTIHAIDDGVIVTLDADDALSGDRMLERWAAEYGRCTDLTKAGQAPPGG